MLTQKELSEKQCCNADNCPEPMPPTKIQAFKDQFPWIKRYVTGPIAQVYVSRVEPSLLNYSLGWGLEGFFWVYEKIYLLDEKGEIISVEIKRPGKKYFLFGPIVSKTRKVTGVVRYGSSVCSILDGLGEKADSVHFILSYFEYTQAVIVYKLPKGISMLQWIQNDIESEGANFQKEVDVMV